MILIQMFDCICASGGSTKGFLTIGVLYKHEKDIQNVHTYVGCSVGSVIVALLSMGASVVDVHKVGLDSACKLPTGMGWFSSIQTFFTKMGFIENNTYLDRVREYVMKKYGYIPTLLQLHDMTGKNLLICATALIARRRVIFSHATHPNLPVMDALEMSIRMPLIFTPIPFDDDLYIDGGMKCHFPIDLRIGKTLAIHTYNKTRSAAEMLKSPSILEYVGMLLSCASSTDHQCHIDGLLYDIAYHRTGPLKSSDEESMDMFTTGFNAIPTVSNVRY